MTLSPKDRFYGTTEAASWRSAVASSWFQDGLTAALAQMVMNSAPTANDAAAAAAAFNRLEGAKALVQVMMSLAESLPSAKTPISQNLKPV
jgi:glutamate/tyrosine decarboxylase-like PLP-dependent enzyme